MRVRPNGSSYVLCLMSSCLITLSVYMRFLKPHQNHSSSTPPPDARRTVILAPSRSLLPSYLLVGRTLAVGEAAAVARTTLNVTHSVHVRSTRGGRRRNGSPDWKVTSILRRSSSSAKLSGTTLRGKNDNDTLWLNISTHPHWSMFNLA